YPTNRITERELEYLGRIPEKKNISVMIIEGDALKIPFPKVNKIISNLPFEISYEFLLRLLEYGDFKKSVLILQKEVVETLLKDARMHGYGLLSVIAGLYWNISIEKQLRSSDFFPSPEVDTEIISIKFKPQSEQYFEKRSDFILFLRGIMRYKNKILRNAVKLWLKHEKVAKNTVDYSKFIQIFPNLKALQTNSDYNSFSDIPVRQITPSRLFDLFSLASSFPKN
ncbi:MAG: rRNA adenine N-6-methyltransferase family protein, partial [Promethearchaeota archaeon]